MMQGCERSQTKIRKNSEIWVKCHIWDDSKRKNFHFDSAKLSKKRKSAEKRRFHTPGVALQKELTVHQSSEFHLTFIQFI